MEALEIFQMSVRVSNILKCILCLTEENFEICFESETASFEDLLPSCKGLVSLERIQQTVGEMEVCNESFDKIEFSRDTLLQLSHASYS